MRNFKLDRQKIAIAIAWLMFSLLAATIFYGIILAVIFHDDRILKATASNPFVPVIQMWNYGSSPLLQKVFGSALALGMLLSAAVLYLVLRKKKEPLGNASFQELGDLQRGNWFRKGGHVFGRFGNQVLRMLDDRHYLIIGPTRSGKGVGFVVPNAIAHEGSMLVTDLKGEIWKATAGHRRKNGNKVFRFAPGQEDTHHYNPLDFIRLEIGNRTTDIQNIASILIPEKGGDNAVWQGIAQQVAAGLISYVLESKYYHGRRHLGEVNALLNCGENLQDLMKFILLKEPGLSLLTTDSFNSYIQLPEKAASSALMDLQNAMKPWKNERIVAATQFTDIDLKLHIRPISIYLTPNITDITLLRPLLTLFIQQLLNLLTLEHNPSATKVLFLLDEFRQLKKMDDVMQKLPYVAGYNIKFCFIIQDLKNLDEIYGETSRHSLLGNCGYQLILGANDQATAEYVSRALGKLTVRYKTVSHSAALMGQSKRTLSETIRERDLMMPQEVRQLPEDRFVLLVEGQKPICGRKLKFFESEPFKSASSFSQDNVPQVPRIEYRPQMTVPAVMENYGSPADHAPSPVPVIQAESETESAGTKNEPKTETITVVTAPAADNSRRVSRKSRPSMQDLFDATVPDPEDDNSQSNAEAMIAKGAEADKRLPERVAAVEEAVNNAAKRVSKRAKPNLEELLNATVPDPEPDKTKTVAA